MKVEELRIGNWIIAISDNRSERQICMIGVSGHVGLMREGTTTGDGTYIENIQPIVLTEEWLLKFGFVLNTNWNMPGLSFYEAFHNLGLYYLIKSKSPLGRIIYRLGYPDKESKTYRSPMSKGIEYVHELQNLYFSLTGEELKI